MQRLVRLLINFKLANYSRYSKNRRNTETEVGKLGHGMEILLRGTFERFLK